MWAIFRSCFPPRVAVGEVLEFDDPFNAGNPFSKPAPHRVVVLGVLGGWVNYRWERNVYGTLQNESMDRRSFAFCYKHARVTPNV